MAEVLLPNRKLDKLKPDQIVWEIRRQKMGNTKMTRNVLYSIRIINVDRENRSVLMSWNGNTPQWVNERTVSKWKLTKPEPKSKISGLPTY